jgi:hypothetical protein
MAGAFSSGPGGNLTFTLREAPPQMELDVLIAERGSVDASAGVAVVRGTLSCSREAEVEITGQLRQRKGRSIFEADFFTSVVCDGATTWEAEAISRNGLFSGGGAEVAVGAFAFDPERGDFSFDEAQATTRLRGRGEPR